MRYQLRLPVPSFALAGQVVVVVVVVASENAAAALEIPNAFVFARLVAAGGVAIHASFPFRSFVVPDPSDFVIDAS